MTFLAAFSTQPGSAERSPSRGAHEERGCAAGRPSGGCRQMAAPCYDLCRLLFLAGRFLGPLDSTPQSRLTDRQDSSPVR